MTWIIIMMMMILNSTSSQKLQVTPSIGGVQLPIFTPSIKDNIGNHYTNTPNDQYTAASAPLKTVVPAPTQAPRSSYRSADTAQHNMNKLQVDQTSSSSINKNTYQTPTFNNITSSNGFHRTSYAAPIKSFADPEGVYSRNNTSRFFSLNPGSGSQTLDLGLSFTIPFLSIPTSSLFGIGDHIGDVTSTALASLMDINWPSVIFIGVVILGAALLLPQLAGVISELTSQLGGLGGTGTGYGGGTGGSYTTTSYGRTMERVGSILPVAPMTSILTQLDDALAQYDLDSTSCLQRAVCSYIGNSEARVEEGSADSTQMIVAGLARSGIVDIVGRGPVTDAVTEGLRGSDCQIQYPKCPFSIAGILKFLATYATLMNR